MKQFYIISGGRIEDDFACGILQEGEPDYVIAVDSGLEFLYRNRILPDLAVGDFDSVSSETLQYFKAQRGVTFLKLNPMKDDTDTEFAIRRAIEMGAEKIMLLGATGSRMDHVLGNIELLGIGLEHQIPIMMLDAHNRIRMVDRGIVIKKEEQFGTYVSLIPYTPKVNHVYLKGFLYPLSDYLLKGFCSIGVSNEIAGEEASIEFGEGILIVIESKD